jgi:hypothetical protein
MLRVRSSQPCTREAVLPVARRCRTAGGPCVTAARKRRAGRASCEVRRMSPQIRTPSLIPAPSLLTQHRRRLRRRMPMEKKRRIAAAAITFCIITATIIRASVPLPMSVTSAAGQAGQNTSTTATLYVLLSNSDGTPKTDAAVTPAPDRVPTEWGVQTFGIPSTFQMPCNFGTPSRPQMRNLPGQLRVRTISKGVNATNEPVPGLYALEVSPVAPCTAQGALIRWVQGEYHFVVTYSKNDERGSTSGVLVIR